MATILRRVILALLVGGTVQQHDPLTDFCRRFAHQTAVVDRRLYIDGGYVNYNPLAQYPANESNTGLLYADLDVDNIGMPQEYDNLTKPADVPDVDGGILWPDTVNKLLYLYGGEFTKGSPQPFTSWMYDIIYNTWNKTTADPTQSSIQRASFGAGIAVQDRALGFYYGGWLSNNSIPNWGSRRMALSSFLTYDMVQNTWSNSSGPDSVGRAEGVMVYIPASDRGMLVYFGGVQTPDPNGTVIAQSLEDILLYDIANSKWYTQKATGQIPQDRRRFCAGVTWAEDNSSYNIYLYGGLAIPEGVGYDDIYILSIPSFTWIKWYPTTADPGFPHHSMTCNVIDGAQMIVMGGTFPNSTACDVPQNYGMHNMDLGKQNPEQKKWIRFRPNITTYEVPSEIISVIGGSATGGATLQTPTNGFDNADLQTYFQRVYTPQTRLPNRAIPTQSSTNTTTSATHSTPVGAIVGGVIGGITGLLLLSGLLLWYLRQRNHQNQPPTPVETQPTETKSPESTNGSEQPAWTGTGRTSMAPTELPDSTSVSTQQRWTGQSGGSMSPTELPELSGVGLRELGGGVGVGSTVTELP